MNKGNKKEFISLLSKKLDKNLKETNHLVDQFFSTIEEFVFNEPNRISFTGKLTISIYERKERVYKHPKTKEKIFSPASKSLRVKIGEVWKKELKNTNN